MDGYFLIAAGMVFIWPDFRADIAGFVLFGLVLSGQLAARKREMPGSAGRR